MTRVSLSLPNGLGVDLSTDPSGRVLVASCYLAPPAAPPAETQREQWRRWALASRAKRRAMSRSKRIASRLRAECFAAIDRRAPLMHPAHRIELRQAAMLLAEAPQADWPAQSVVPTIRAAARFAARLT